MHPMLWRVVVLFEKGFLYIRDPQDLNAVILLKHRLFILCKMLVSRQLPVKPISLGPGLLLVAGIACIVDIQTWHLVDTNHTINWIFHERGLNPG